MTAWKWFASFFGVAFALEWLRVNAGIPVTIMDLIAASSCVGLVVLVLKERRDANKKKRPRRKIELDAPIWKQALAALTFILLGACLVWMGAMEPLTYMSGPKGSGHGYTLITIGASMFVGGLVVPTIHLRKFWRKLRKV